ncbi:MAG: gliding motility-associated ABC transporter substrate-binding protein GldG [Bacteroidales bacterium]|jgi:gliding-associated putative ABC transporter substrate-binding component GldG|nr:gliding motility-associated ABC transporter substrate-binding protein GldG [Bacteroidales bacterium]
MKKRSQFIQAAIVSLFATLIIVVAVNVVSSYFNAKADLTKHKRFTLSPTTIDLLTSSQDEIYIKFYLTGDNVPDEYALIVDRAKEMLAEFKDVSSNVNYEFIDPFEGKRPEEIHPMLEEFVHKGLIPIPVNKNFSQGGQRATTQFILPGAIISYRNQERPVTLIETDIRNYYTSTDFSYMRMEYNFVKALKPLLHPKKSRVAFVNGHGEMDWPCVAWVTGQLGEKMKDFYNVESVTIGGRLNALRNISVADSVQQTVKELGNKYDLLIVAAPTQWVSDTDKYIIDQHVMRGGRVLWLVDGSNASMDSVENVRAFYAQQNLGRRSLEQLFFTYGVRINPDMLMDMEDYQMLKIGNNNLSFPYLLKLTNFTQHPITQRMEMVRANFASSIDFVNDGDGLKKTVLAATSSRSRIKTAPGFVALKEGKDKPNVSEYNRSHIPVAVLVEGEFSSAFAGRLPIALITEQQFHNLTQSKPTKQIFLSDGDMMRNYVDYQALSEYVPMNGMPARKEFLFHEMFLPQEGIYPTGYDPNIGFMYDNTEFMVNCVDYLCDNSDLIDLRSKVLQIGRLDSVKVNAKRTQRKYQLLNLALPLALLLAFGGLAVLFRRMRYAR